MTIDFKLSQEDLDTIRGIIREEIAQALLKKEPKYYSRQEAALILKISLPTLGAWIKRGKIKAKKIGNRVLIEETQLTIL